MVLLAVFCLAAYFLTTTEASLQNILSSAVDQVTNILFKPDEHENSKVEKVILEGRSVLAKLTTELQRLGVNAYKAAIQDKDYKTQEFASSCAKQKGNFATGVLKIKRDELEDCVNSSASFVNDLTESFFNFNDRTSPFIGGLNSVCKGEQNFCKEMEGTTLTKMYETWGSRLSAVHRCVHKLISHTAKEYMFIFKSLREECLMYDLKRKGRGDKRRLAKNVNIFSSSVPITEENPTKRKRDRIPVPRPKNTAFKKNNKSKAEPDEQKKQ